MGGGVSQNPPVIEKIGKTPLTPQGRDPVAMSDYRVI